MLLYTNHFMNCKYDFPAAMSVVQWCLFIYYHAQLICCHIIAAGLHPPSTRLQFIILYICYALFGHVRHIFISLITILSCHVQLLFLCSPYSRFFLTHLSTRHPTHVSKLRDIENWIFYVHMALYSIDQSLSTLKLKSLTHI